MKSACVICEGNTLVYIGEPECVGKFPVRQDITVLGPDVPRGCLSVVAEVEEGDGEV